MRRRYHRSLSSLSKIAVMATALALAMAAAAGAPAEQDPQSANKTRYPALLHFEATNNGEGNPIKFYARGLSYEMLLADEEADVVLHGETQPSGDVQRGKLIVVNAYASVLRMRFADSNLPTSLEPSHPAGQTSANGTAVVYRGIYPGVDVVLSGNERAIRFNVDVSRGADTNHIVLEFAGATQIELNAAGNAIVHAGHATLVLQKPTVTIVSGGTRQAMPGGYRIEPHSRLRFLVDSFMDHPAIEN